MIDLRDDDDAVELSTGGSKYFDRSDHGKQERRETKKHTKDLKKLETKVQLQSLKGSQEKKDEAASFGTKTLEQEIREQVQDAKQDPKPDTLIEEGKRQAAVQQQTQYEQEQQMT